MITFTLAQRVTFTHTLRRDTGKWNGAGWEKVWRRYRADGRWANGDIIRQAGIVVGIRTLSNGMANYNGPDEQATYTHTENVPAVLIATHLRRRPVLVPPDAVAPEVG